MTCHRRMHHRVADAPWTDQALLAAVAGEVLPVLVRDSPCYWIINDTGMRKYGKHSVGVVRQYCGQLGKTENCQVAVSLSLATLEVRLPLAWRLYLPREWTDGAKCCKAAVVPQTVGFATKGALAWAHIEAALAAGIPKGIVLADAGYGDEAAFGDQLQECGLSYAVGIRQTAKLWWGEVSIRHCAGAHARAAPHAPEARRGTPADQCAGTGPKTARQKLPHRHLARRHQHPARIALCPCALQGRAIQPPP